MGYRQSDAEILLLCEDLINCLNRHKSLSGTTDAERESSPIGRRLNFIRQRIETERRLIEEVSAPGRLLIEHLSLFAGKMDYTIGFIYGNIKTGRGLLSGVRIGEWGTITLDIGDVSLCWRDADVGYMFYPDRIIIRPKDSGQDDITLFFSYSFKYDKDLIKAFQDVQENEQTLYWHDDMPKEQ